MPPERPVLSPDLAKIAQTHVDLFREEEARRWARINSNPVIEALRQEDPDFLSGVWTLRTQKLGNVLVSKLGEDYYQIGYLRVKVKDGRYLFSTP